MSDAAPFTNRLAAESSPYLRLHRHNPVDWYPWGEEALARAREEDRPIFLSVGYSTCYWCHVMERESFSDPAIAERMNRHFVNIKLDREERPDLDEIYMVATQLLTGQGGWPNSVFLTPRLEPFYAGTYFPPEDRYGRPGFPRLLASLAEAWTSRRGEVKSQAESLGRAVRHHLERQLSPGGPVPRGAAAASLAELERDFDSVHGGFGGAPKFPTPSNLYLLAEMAGEHAGAAEMLRVTLDRMARGGIYDQLGGGFHRYSTDAGWQVPHFEKMLYDNGFLLELYALQAAREGDPEMARVAGEIAAYLRREMTSPEGALWSAQDAETDGDEGAFYVWRREELQAALGEESFGFLAPIYGFDAAPGFEGGRYVLHLPQEPAHLAERRRMDRAELWAEIEPLRRRLLEVRAEREPPLVDDKVLADWNGIAIAGLATAGRLLEEPRMTDQAAAAARFVLERMRPQGRLLHAWRDGRARIPAFLSDYVHLVRGCLALHSATGEASWLAAARELADEQSELLGDPRGGFFGAAESPDLLARGKEIFDGASPGANAVATLNLLELADRTGEERWLRQAEAALRCFGALVERVPQAARTMALAARRYGLRADGAVAASAAPTAAADPVAVSLEAAPADEAGWRELRLRLEIEPGWHLYAASADPATLRPTTLEGRHLELAEVRYPPPAPPRPGSGLEGAPVWQGTVEVVARGRPRGGGEPALVVVYQACDERRCLAPVRRSLALGAAA